MKYTPPPSLPQTEAAISRCIYIGKHNGLLFSTCVETVQFREHVRTSLPSNPTVGPNLYDLGHCRALVGYLAHQLTC